MLRLLGYIMVLYAISVVVRACEDVEKWLRPPPPHIMVCNPPPADPNIRLPIPGFPSFYPLQAKVASASHAIGQCP